MTPDRFASILNAIIETAKERGMADPGSDYALACYQLLETARTEADVWGVDPGEIGLAGFDAELLLSKPRQAA